MKPKNKKQAYKVFELLEQKTKAVILARHGAMPAKDFGEYFNLSLKLDDKILEEAFGTCDLVKLGKKWELLKKEKTKKKRVKIKRKIKRKIAK